MAVVQARMRSARLPGKSIILLRGRPIIEHVLRRVRLARTLSEVVLATSEQPRDDVLRDVADRLGTRVVRGPEDDVLRRVVLAARACEADVVVRVCADNPLVAPEEIDRIVTHHLRTRADYSFNHRPALDNQYPDGLGVEVANMTVLEALDRQALEASNREHVTAYIWLHLGEFHVETIVAPSAIAGADIKLDLDTAADFERLETLLAEAPEETELWSAEEIVETYRWKIGNVVRSSS